MAEARTVALSPIDVAIMRGDVRELAPADRVTLVRQLADEAALRWGGSPPVLLITGENGRLVPYLTKSGADQLAAVRGASVTALDVDLDARRHVVNVQAYASDATGRTNVDVGSCDYDPKVAKSYARARMVATTRARRRVILGLLGSGFAWSEAGDRQAGLEDAEL